MTPAELLALSKSATPGPWHETTHRWCDCGNRDICQEDEILTRTLRNHADALAEAWIALEQAQLAMEERRRYADGWEWKYGTEWDAEDQKVKSALDRLRAAGEGG